jgi:formylmethanofuran dehydrogenase subunit E
MRYLSFQDTISFHGHNGPFLAIGYRAGRYAMDKLKPEYIKDISCCVNIIGRTPYTCIIDGIQCATFCTTGKSNLSIKHSARDISIVFKNKSKTINLIPRKNIIKDALSTEKMTDNKQWKAVESIDSIFIIKEE